MTNYQQYQRFKKQPEDKKFKLGKILVVLAAIFVVYLIGRSIFGSSPAIESNIPDEEADTVNTEIAAGDNTNENVNSQDETNANENLNANLNVNVDTSSAEAIDIESCTRMYSRGSSDEKKVSLTFNVGTSKEGEIQKVLDTLSSTNTPADFFVRGEVAEENPDLVSKLTGAGLAAYNLSYNHPHFNDLPESGVIEQLSKSESAISQQTGKTTKPFFRPPYGEADEDVVAVAKDQGYCTVSWTVDALDWSADYSAAQSKERVLSNVGNGSIILMQAGNAVTAEIVSDIITELKNSGYEIVDLASLLK